ncbi:MAG: hypothetical protein JGK17_13070 [Microcoleus sp. PH2017_10_PVI_O_A]|uniref:hypothetical protein n=1 Tax=unclassified Microcoleus TaxID=2642155 RepID=UPI001D8004C6|nr:MULTISPECIES: hypothetical protein [unclassified Microcoleus]MCC3406493.1 hypothetical protein [Microcoleus sp. PH2017_10_PVI_O_A]MCC3460510.1 hypothetical protein [Microcoleus sp. PH2017_11_PCY_U_A]MCC3478927.1 hypothetical protein [Microcoleus sp. PH2017_12_PCY_D_A]MCC3559862.1 hypothetical protein [Microcoleus sp. PH2017_27_LUM_O_A]
MPALTFQKRSPLSHPKSHAGEIPFIPKVRSPFLSKSAIAFPIPNPKGISPLLSESAIGIPQVKI